RLSFHERRITGGQELAQWACGSCILSAHCRGCAAGGENCHAYFGSRFAWVWRNVLFGSLVIVQIWFVVFLFRLRARAAATDLTQSADFKKSSQELIFGRPLPHAGAVR